MGFDNLEFDILEDTEEVLDGVNAHSERGIVESIKSFDKPLHTNKVVKGEFFPKITLKLGENSHLDNIRLEALKSLLVNSVSVVSNGEDLANLYSTEDKFHKFCIVISNDSTSFVVGTLLRGQLSFFYNLLPNIDMELNFSETERYDKSKILALR